MKRTQWFPMTDLPTIPGLYEIRAPDNKHVMKVHFLDGIYYFDGFHYISHRDWITYYRRGYVWRGRKPE